MKTIYNHYHVSSIVRIARSMRIGQYVHRISMEETRDAYIILLGTALEKLQLEYKEGDRMGFR